MSGKAKDILQMDLYGLLGIESTATTKEIKKAYRQKALTCHPDKNPDNPKAVELFHQLSQALEVLTDAAAKAAYDKICAAKKQAEERNRKLDDKRKKIKLDLESRERQAEAQSQEEVQITRTLEEEIARLREEGSRQLEEEQRLIREQIQREREAQQQQTGGYTQTISGVERCSKSNVTPKLKLQSVLMVMVICVSSQPSLPVMLCLLLKWKCKKDNETNGGYSEDILFRLLQKGSLTNERDYESVVMMRMRQAAERQRLIEQMQRDDDGDGARP
ncbi:dnaJ homolog subfamily C member 17 isoform X3 [Siniperca chuatsi]|uniref:dnaJ homolog subfamily C member 17 isoform X3 n=1 Tax=Siniperca chuatsi TaxID=119488 RepID=UPI001CE217CA|nr:dnaJ homolog subfamily C member 17 isoform X3 [Siniperca chuatsi]